MQILVLYGSETGTAEEVAFRIFSMLRQMGLKARFMSMDNYDVTNLPCESVVIFIAATTGDGEAPSNMMQFWRFLLRKSLDSSSLLALKYAVFGLGDSSYEKFNAAAR